MTPKQQIIAGLGIALIILSTWALYGGTIKKLLNFGNSEDSLTSLAAEALGAYGAWKVGSNLLSNVPGGGGGGAGGGGEEEPSGGGEGIPEEPILPEAIP